MKYERTENSISAEDVSTCVAQTIRQCYDRGVTTKTSKGETRCLFDFTMEIKNPRLRHLNIQGRTSNIFQLIGETLWVLAGKDNIKPYLTTFVPRAPQYSNDGETWHDAYGPRLFGVNRQLQSALELLEGDINTRQAYVSITDPNLDSQARLAEAGVPNSARPCNNGIYFWVENNQLMMKTVQRSGDLIFGAGSINLFEFTVIHELMYIFLKRTYPELKLGTYRHNTINLHLYMGDEKIADQVKAIVEGVESRGFTFRDLNRCENKEYVLGDFENVRDWSHLSELVRQFVEGCEHILVFGKMNEETTIIPQELDEGLMEEYLHCAYMYILQKSGLDDNQDMVIKKWEQVDGQPGVLKSGLDQALLHSKFRKFPMFLEA